MGKLDVHISHGGGPDLGGLIPVAIIAVAVMALAGGSGAAIGGVLVTLALWVVGAVGVAVALAVVLLLATRRSRADRKTAMIQARAEAQQAIEDARERRETLRHQRRVAELAASAPRVEVRNVIDPLPLLAAAFNTRQSYTAQAQPQPAWVTIRGELER
jgi:hypothetical protein